MARYRLKTTLAACTIIFLTTLSGCATSPDETASPATPAAAPPPPGEATRFIAFGAVEPPAPSPPEATDSPTATGTQGTRPRFEDYPASNRVFPSLARETIQDNLPIPRVIDLTVQPDDLWDRIRNGFAMPNLTSPLVVDRQIWYASRPNDIKRMVERSRRYLFHIVHELEKRGMPTELALLPMVESAFNPMAYSRAHASGLWQFIPSTGRSYKLEQNWWYDARRDIIASTNAALDYLQFLYDMHGDWHLALASYNWGENAVARAIERNRAKGLPRDYLSLSMPQETRYYVPKLQALKNIVANPSAFDITLDAIPNERYFVTVTIKNMDIRLAAKLAEMPIEELIALNPGHKRPIIAMETLVLPADRAEVFQANLENSGEPLVTWQRYTFKRGDRLERIAARHNISLANLRLANGITAKTRVRPGFPLLVPVKGVATAQEPRSVPGKATAAAVTNDGQEGARTVVRRFTHHVVRGETLTSIANKYDVTINDLKRWNKIGRLLAGQKLVVERTVTVPARPARPSGRASSARKPAARNSTQDGKPATRTVSQPRSKASPGKAVRG